MAITYNQGANIITVKGGSEATPLDLDDVYTEDTGATNGRILLDGVIDADPDTFSLDEQPKPADDLAVPLKISCTARGGATCNISGTDTWDNAVSETGIDISSGSATTTQRFKTVDANGITVNGLQNNDDFDIYQDRWGVVYKKENVYIFGCFIVLGDGSTASWLADTKKVIIADAAQFQTAHVQKFIEVKANSVLRFGTVVDESEKKTKDGCYFVHLNPPTGWWSLRFVAGQTSGSATIYLYSCSAEAITAGGGGIILFAPTRVWNFEGSNKGAIERSLSATTINRVTLDDMKSFINPAGSNNDLVISGFRPAVDKWAGSDVYFDNSEIKYTETFKVNNNASKDAYLTNITATPNWVISFGTGTSTTVYRRYTIDLQVLDRSNNAIQGVTVTLDDKDGTQVFSTTTDANGQITQATVVRGTYSAATGGTLQDKSPHKLTIKKTGYQTYKKQFTLDEKIDWRIALQVAAPVFDGVEG